jgi:hypothetical protein
MSNIRYDLIPVQGITEVSKVLTHKLNDHKVNEWKYGISWTEVLSLLKKHLTEFELGNDFTEDGLLHIAEVASNALILAEYYSIYPQGDDRVLAPINKPIVGCDLDDVIFDFTGSYEKRFGTKLSDYWNGDYNMSENLKITQNEKEFWVNMPVKNIPSFEIDYYITARSIPIEWTQEAIQKNNLPKAPIYSLPWNVSKIDTLRELKVSIMIDDKFETFKECKENGIFCYLMDSNTNKHYNVGHHRIYDLNLKIK